MKLETVPALIEALVEEHKDDCYCTTVDAGYCAWCRVEVLLHEEDYESGQH